jgi:hypothetical protein
MTIFEISWNSTCRFAHNLKVADDPYLYQFIFIERVSPLVGILRDIFDSFLDIKVSLTVEQLLSVHGL